MIPLGSDGIHISGMGPIRDFLGFFGGIYRWILLRSCGICIRFFGGPRGIRLSRIVGSVGFIQHRMLKDPVRFRCSAWDSGKSGIQISCVGFI
jgi:hypothetical protein